VTSTDSPTAAQLAAYAGLAPLTRRSGSSIRAGRRAGATTSGSRNALWLSTFCSLRNKRSAAYYARKRAEGKKHNAAVICLARGRCDLVHKLLRTGLTYGELPRAPSLPPQIPSRSPSNPLDKSIGTRPSLHDFLHAAPAASEHGGGS
jgi:hypothetical protein